MLFKSDEVGLLINLFIYLVIGVCMVDYLSVNE